MTHHVFVYGSLKQGFGNHHFLATTEHVGRATIAFAKLLNLGAFPGMVPGLPNQRVFGEVYRISDEVLRQLDRLEGHPHFYSRSKQLVSLSREKRLESWCYF